MKKWKYKKKKVKKDKKLLRRKVKTNTCKKNKWMDFGRQNYMEHVLQNFFSRRVFVHSHQIR